MRSDGIFDAQRFHGCWLLQAETCDCSGARIRCEAAGLEVRRHEGGYDCGEDAEGGEGDGHCRELPREDEHEVEDDAGAEQALRPRVTGPNSMRGAHAPAERGAGAR